MQKVNYIFLITHPPHLPISPSLPYSTHTHLSPFWHTNFLYAKSSITIHFSYWLSQSSIFSLHSSSYFHYIFLSWLLLLLIFWLIFSVITFLSFSFLLNFLSQVSQIQDHSWNSYICSAMYISSVLGFWIICWTHWICLVRPNNALLPKVQRGSCGGA
jgi:hypothetical protein